MAEAFRVTSQELYNQDKGTVAQYANKVADQVDHISSYLEGRDVAQLLEDAESFARRRPELFLGGAFITGLLVGRFIKSSGERRMARRESEMSYRPYGYTEDYSPGTTTFDRSEDPYRTYSPASDVGFSTTE